MKTECHGPKKAATDLKSGLEREEEGEIGLIKIMREQEKGNTYLP